MNAGDILIRLGLITAAAAAVAYAGPLRGRKGATLGHALFVAHATLLFAALALLGTLFLAHDFSYQYVAHNSSRALTPALTLAALWAGQEGSILLWAMVSGLLGVFLLAQPGKLGPPAMFFVSATQVFMTLLLMIRSPFVRTAVVPADGLGLNPLLEDPWMVAHPPVLFLGYAAMVAPFALACAALARGEYKEWSKQVWPWALLAVVTLGTGIVLGGVWAYKVLGWGGYWGWDPVENASLVPWLLAVAMLHGLLIQKTLGAMVRTNLLLAVLGWLTVLGGTYLTRSGVLQDFSVHSFADMGLGPVLNVFLGLTTIAGVVLLGARWKTITAGAANWVSVSRESALWLGLMTVLALAVLVAAGTTMPLLTGLAGKPSSVQPEFYHRVIAPLGLMILLLMAIAPALRWTKQQGRSWLSMAPQALAAGIVALAAALSAGLRDPEWLVLLFVTGLALGINLWMAVKLFRRGWAYGAGYLGHAGVAVMAVGIAVSSSFGRTERLQLREGQTAEALGYTITYTGATTDPRGAEHMNLKLQRGAWTFDARPRLMPSPRGDGMMRTPAIDAWRDLYLSPIETKTVNLTEHGDVTWLEKGTPVEIAGVRYTFTGFRMVHAEKIKVYADLDVRIGGVAMHASPGIEAGPDGSVPFPAEVNGLGTIRLARLDADRGRVAVMLPGSAPLAARIAFFDFSTKPLVNLVWIGALLTLAGTALAGVRRAREQVAAPARRPVPGAVPHTA